LVESDSAIPLPDPPPQGGRGSDPPELPRIAGRVPHPSSPRVAPPPGAWDTHAHIFGPSDKFPYQPGRGYTPPDAPVERFIALLDHLGFANGLVVQGNAHVYDNSVVLDALTRFPRRLRGVAITDTRIKPETLRDWHERGMRGLRFHLFPRRPNYIRGVSLDVFAVFRKTMAELGWVVQFFCDHRMLPETAAALAVYRLSTQFPDYPDAQPLHGALLAANPERLMWGTDWPHPSIPAAVMPDDGHLLNLFHDWTPDEQTRRRILVDTPARLFGR
jgi:2-pyrone-4,6-dicarboxylate lactonase